MGGALHSKERREAGKCAELCSAVLYIFADWLGQLGQPWRALGIGMGVPSALKLQFLFGINPKSNMTNVRWKKLLTRNRSK
jgi:hypothetical protein